MSPNPWGGGGGCGVSANEYSCTQEPNKLRRSNTIFNIWSHYKSTVLSNVIAHARIVYFPHFGLGYHLYFSNEDEIK